MSVRACTFLAAFAVLASSPAYAMENFYCSATGDFYPAAKSCPMPWVKLAVPGVASPQNAQLTAQLVQCKVADRDIRLLTAAQCPVEGARVKAEADARAKAAQSQQAAASTEARQAAIVAQANQAAIAAATPQPTARAPDTTINCTFFVETAPHTSEMRNERMTAAQCDAVLVREKAASLTEEQEDDKKEAARAREFKNAAGKPFAIYKEEEAQANQDADARGFKRMTFEDFKLDGADLARDSGKVSLSGAYQKFGHIEYLFPNSGYVMQLMTSGNVSSGIALVTDGAPRDVRKYFLECPDDLLPSSRGCPVNVLGHATMCELKTLAGSTSIPCLAVDDGWHVIEKY